MKISLLIQKVGAVNVGKTLKSGKTESRVSLLQWYRTVGAEFKLEHDLYGNYFSGHIKLPIK